MLGGPEDRVVAVLARHCGATAAGSALVARLGQVAEIAAPGPLEQVPADRGHVAQLPGGSGEECLREGRVVAAHLRMGRQVAVGDGRTDTQPTVGGERDVAEGQFLDVDEERRPFHTGLHQVDEVRAASQEAGTGFRGEQGHGPGHVEGALVSELPHATASSASAADTSAACATARTIDT